MTTPDPDRPNTIHWPPILYVGVLAGAWVLHRFWPLPAVLPEPWRSALGLPLLTAGLIVGAAALLRFRAERTSYDPTAPARALATGGIYRFTRNPMYLGALAAFLGLGLWLANTWLVAFVLPAAFALQALAIAREEAYLDRRFGEAYRDYRRQVRRWL